MISIDWTQIINWIVSGAIGLLFGVIGGYITYKFERKRDDIQWEREKLKLEQQWKQEREHSEITWQRKLEELELESERHRQELPYQELYQKRVEGITSIYNQLVDLEKSISEWLREYPPREASELGERAYNKIHSFRWTFEKYRIYLNADILSRLENIYQDYRLQFPNFADAKRIHGMITDSSLLDKLCALRESLEQQFRELIAGESHHT
jgi:hypothetical protein